MPKKTPSTQSLCQDKRLALIVGNKLGDGIIAMSLRDRLTESGYKVVVFGNAIEGLKDLFPKADIQKMPSRQAAKKAFSSFDILLYPQQEDNGGFSAHKHQKELIFRNYAEFHKKEPMRKIYEELSRTLLSCRHTHEENSFQIPKEWQKKSPKKSLINTSKRVVIHPMSGEAFRNWSKYRFLKLAKKLKKKGFSPVFIVSPKDLKEWQKLIALDKRCSDYEVKAFDKLIDLAKFIYESSSFIGNDSGPGHLAALLSVPTLTLCARKRLGARWAPSNHPRAILYSSLPLLGPYLQGKYWKHFISVRKCLKRFCELAK